MRNFFKSTILICGFIIFFMGLNYSHVEANVKTYHQHGKALEKFDVSKFKYVHNHNYTRKDYHKHYRRGYRLRHNHIKSYGGNYRTYAKTLFFLTGAKNTRLRNHWNPQSITVSPTGKYAFVMYPGEVVRYNLFTLKKLGVSYKHPVLNNKQIKSAVKFGPHIDTGHGQSLTYNHKTHHLWFLNMGTINKYAKLEELSIKTLKPIQIIKFHYDSNYSLSNELTFDKKGNLYTYTRTSGDGAIKNGTLRISKGIIHNHNVKFKMIMQGIRHAPGYRTQSLSYNPKNNRLYFVSDGGILSAPVSGLGHLKPSQIRDTKFLTHREFEGLAFTRSGKGYLLLNRSPEIMTFNHF
ncbi:hypothetical protein MOO46_05425 [Apilactobacillus apisilvae]|uniref:Extracellular protein n=1 Tax=Apilactobacillus apisilvae TaxID=2923364 RepID=A0ABY4PGS0_9LACO|nr:hypothetical protein [Apilactobacillus apisilvae]UQS84691.1 hypothetical protein MOO46_05425 [Apilactobacillus apisilvae]